MRTKTVRFPNDDGQQLTGLLDLPPGKPQAWALFAHCFTCTKNLKAAANISQALADNGFAVLRFDFTGLGQSEGDFADTSFSSNVADIVAAARFLADEYEAPALLVGHSLGGTAVLQAAPQIESCRAVATVASPAEPEHVSRLFAGDKDTILKDGEAEVMLGGRPFRIRRQFLNDLEAHDLPSSIGELRRALLIMHSPLDDVVEIANATRLFTSALHPKSFVSLDRADHLLSDQRDSRYAGAVMASWASRYVGLDEREERLPAKPGLAVSRTPSGGFASQLSLSGHRLTADEPESYGGTDIGPTPYDLLAGALAACTSMTIRMYAEHKKLPMEAVTVSVRHEKIHAKDCEDCESTEGRIDHFDRELAVEGDLTEAELARIAEIADRCPVHRTLEGEIRVRTRLAR